MKRLIIIPLLSLLSCSNKKNKSSETIASTQDTSISFCSIPEIDNLILRCDTSYDPNKDKGHVIRCFDKYGQLLKKDSINLFESDSKKIFEYKVIYDSVGHFLYESISEGLITFHCYSYRYDKEGHLIEKQGYSSGEIGVKILYIYKDGKLIKEITERLGNRIEKNFQPLSKD
jgi:hypothetical protein